MNAEIVVFPAQAISALDMAELMDAALLRDGILQGCSLSIDSNHELQITSGRMIIKGRLAIVTAGQIDRPEGILTSQTCYITAMCDLSGENPFTIEMLTAGDHSDLVDRAQDYTDTSFNVNAGVAIFELGTTTVDPTVGVTAFTPIATDQRSAKNRAAITAGVQKDLNSQIALENQHWERHELWRQQFARHWYQRSNFSTYVNTADGVNLPANTTGTFVFRKEKDAVTRVIDQSSGGSVPSLTIPHIDLSKQYGYNGRSTGTNPGILDDSAGLDPGGQRTPTYDSEYHIPTNVNNVLVHMGILGVRIDNATRNGAGSANCVLQGYYTDGDHVVVKVRNVGSTAAVLKISVRSFYIVDVDF